MKRIILFRYHNQFNRNKELLTFMKYLNPGVGVFGLYGGPDEHYDEANSCFDNIMTHNYHIKDQDSEWKWKHSDMAYQLWYRDYGYQIDFDIMHSLEWDLLYFAPLDILFAGIDQHSLGLSGLIPLKKIENKWYWTKHEGQNPEWQKLHNHFKQNYSYDQSPYGMIGPGTTLPRQFLEKIKDIEIPRLSNDELRLPLLAQVFGFSMKDTNFFRKWFSNREFRYFNSNAVEVETKTIENELRKPAGRRVFHPYGKDLSYDKLVYLHNLIPAGKNNFAVNLRKILNV